MKESKCKKHTQTSTNETVTVGDERGKEREPLDVSFLSEKNKDEMERNGEDNSDSAEKDDIHLEF